MNFVHAQGQQWSQGALWPEYIRYPLEKTKKLISGWSLDIFERTNGPLLPSINDFGLRWIPGKLGCSCPGGGKGRIFAIGNYVNQRLLKPVHDWCMIVLRSLPTDGTFNQRKPLDNLVGNRYCYSFDLKSATDRWPLL